MAGKDIRPARRCIGVIVPSSNRIVERVTENILGDAEGIDACYTRIPYTVPVAGAYDVAAFVTAALLLADAGADVICWNATRGAVLGLDAERLLARAIHEATGLRMTSAYFALMALHRREQFGRIGLVTQGSASEGALVRRNIRAQGLPVSAELHLGIEDNRQAAYADLASVATFAGTHADAGGDCVLIWSTNLPGHALETGVGREKEVRIVDSASIAIRSAMEDCIAMAG